jgi:hypothetical protein
MKLAEALIARADAEKRIAQLQQRLIRSAKVQEGDTPPEDPQTLLAETTSLISEMQTLIQSINRTNASTAFDGNRTLTDALAERDMLMKERGILVYVIDNAVVTQPRYGQSEIKFVSTVNIAELQSRVDNLSRRYRELDSTIQQLNWTIDLIDN